VVFSPLGDYEDYFGSEDEENEEEEDEEEVTL